jgi:hypothetical protein
MLRAKFRAQIDYIARIIEVDFHRSVGECEREYEGILSPSVAWCIWVVRVVVPRHVGTGRVHDCS